MGYNPRDAMKDRLDQCVMNCHKIQEQLMFLGDVLYTDYPNIQEQYKIVWAYFDEGQALLRALRDEY